MPYCHRCGKEVEEGLAFCPNCGVPLTEVGERFFRRRIYQGWTIGDGISRGIIAFIGFMILLVGLSLTVGGVAVLSVHSSFADSNDFLISPPVVLAVDSYAIIQKGIQINIVTDLPVWIPDPGDFVQLKMVVTNNEPSKEVFIGIAEQSDASNYLSGVNYHEVDDFTWDYNPWRETPPKISYRERIGGAPIAPIVSSFWVAHVSGPGTQTLTWEPSTGNFWIVGMNSDGSSEVNLEIQIGVRLPILRTIGGILLAVGLILLLIGGSLFRQVL